MTNDMRVYLPDGRHTDSMCSRWQQEDYQITIETIYSKSQRDFIRSNIVPGAVSTLYEALGRPVFYDTSFGNNTLTVTPISGTRLYSLKESTVIFVKNYSEAITPDNRFRIKIIGCISGASSF